MFRFDSSHDRVFARCLSLSTEVHTGRLSVPLQALTFSVTDVLKDFDPLVVENISKYINFKTRLLKMGQTTSNISHGLPTMTSCLHYCLFSRGNKKDNSFAAYKSNIKANKNVTAHLNHFKNACDMHSLRHSHIVVKGQLTADW